MALHFCTVQSAAVPTGQRPNPPPHVAVIVCKGTLTGAVPWANVFWLRNGNAATPSQSDFDSVVGDFRQQFAGLFGAHLVAGWTTTEAQGLYYGSAGIDLKGTSVVSNNGTISVPSAPANVAACIGWTIQAHYRGGHPRTYFCGVPNNEFATAKSFSTAFVASMVQAANAFHSAVNQISHGNFGSAHLGTVSFVLRKEWRSPPLFRDYTPSQAHMDTRIDSMRRRVGRDIPP